MLLHDAFDAMFSSSMLENVTGRIELPGVSRSALRAFLRMMYTGGVDAADWNDPQSTRMPLAILGEVAGLSKKYLVQSMFEQLLEVLKKQL